MRWPIWRVAVAERSMAPKLMPGDLLLVWRGVGPTWLTRTKGLPHRAMHDGLVRVRPGQIVIARNPDKPEMLIVKRAAWHEPQGWWLTSDNPRAGGVDSFRFGAVRPEHIEGRVLGRYWPPRWTSD